MKVIRTIYEHWRYPEAHHQDNMDSWYSPDRLYRYKRNFKTFMPSGKGGMTICRLILDEEIEGSNEIMEVSKCNEVDNFNYRLGRRIAHGRAMKQFKKLYQANLKQQFDELPFMNNETVDGIVI